MWAVVIMRPGGPEVLALREVETPRATADRVLVRVKAAGLNRADLLQRAGHYPAPPDSPQDIPGLEFAGEVAALGAEARLWEEGQRVMGLAGGGAQAEYVLAQERLLAEVPSRLSWAEAGSIPEVFITAHDAFRQAELRPSENVLIHAVEGGVGLAAVQLARAFGAVPYGTSRTADKIQLARAYGLADGAVIRDPVNELAAHARRWTGGRGFDVVLDLAGGAYVQPSIDALALRGRLVFIGTTAGSTAAVKISSVMSRRARLIGTVLRWRPVEEKIAAMRAFAAEVLPLFERGLLRPVIDSQFSFERAGEAHQRLESNASFGKIVLVAEK